MMLSDNLQKVSPIVSIITPNYNGQRFIRRVVESVRRQEIHLEHIVVDDCSSDESWSLLQDMASQYSWLKPVRLEKNSGPVIARNRAIEIAKGRYLAFLDVDDCWLPHKLKTQIDFMIDQRCAISYSDYRFVTEDGSYVGRRLQGFHKIGWHLHHVTRYLGCLTIVIDREKIPGFRIPKITPAYRAEDFLAWSSCILKVGPVLRCPHDLARYAVVPNSRSSNAYKASKSVWRLYRQVEKIPITVSAIYFLFYSIFVVWKRFWYKPHYERKQVDHDYEWSIMS